MSEAGETEEDKDKESVKSSEVAYVKDSFRVDYDPDYAEDEIDLECCMEV
jgi:hypothetical protein